jgi:hypothetical protein
MLADLPAPTRPAPENEPVDGGSDAPTRGKYSRRFRSRSVQFGRTGVSGQRQECPSSLEFVIDDHSSAPLGAPTDAMHHYLFNSMPCAYAWFHH